MDEPVWDRDFTQGKWKVFTAHSTYLLDCDKHLMKRVHEGENDLPLDGTWLPYDDLLRCSVGAPMVLLWSLDGRLKHRTTSTVEAVHRMEG